MADSDLDKDSKVIYGNILYDQLVFAGEGEYEEVPVIEGNKLSGGEIIFFNEKTGKIWLSASHNSHDNFALDIKIERLGGITEVDFSFDYFGSLVGLAECKLMLRAEGWELGYADISDFSLKNDTLSGKGISIWLKAGEINPDYVFYVQNSDMHTILSLYNNWISERAKVDEIYWPAQRVVFSSNAENMRVTSIDTQGKSIKDSLDMMCNMINCSYEITLDQIVVYGAKRVVMPNAQEIEIEESLDKILNYMHLYTEEQGSNARRKVGDFKDLNSIYKYGVHEDDVVIPYYVDADPQSYASKLLAPNPQNTGSFSMIVNKKMNFDKYFVPTYKKNVIINSGSETENWSGSIKVTDGLVGRSSIKISNQASLFKVGAVNKLRLDFNGSFLVSIMDMEGKEILSKQISSSSLAFMIFDVFHIVNEIKFTGNGNIHAISADTSQESFSELVPSEISYSIFKDVTICKISSDDNKDMISLISDIGENAMLIDAVLKK